MVSGCGEIEEVRVMFWGGIFKEEKKKKKKAPENMSLKAQIAQQIIDALKSRPHDFDYCPCDYSDPRLVDTKTGKHYELWSGVGDEDPHWVQTWPNMMFFSSPESEIVTKAIQSFVLAGLYKDSAEKIKEELFVAEIINSTIARWCDFTLSTPYATDTKTGRKFYIHMGTLYLAEPTKFVFKKKNENKLANAFRELSHRQNLLHDESDNKDCGRK